MELIWISLVILIISIIVHFFIDIYSKKKLSEMDGFEGIFHDDEEFE